MNDNGRKLGKGVCGYVENHNGIEVCIRLERIERPACDECDSTKKGLLSLKIYLVFKV